MYLFQKDQFVKLEIKTRRVEDSDPWSVTGLVELANSAVYAWMDSGGGGVHISPLWAPGSWSHAPPVHRPSRDCGPWGTGGARVHQRGTLCSYGPVIRIQSIIHWPLTLRLWLTRKLWLKWPDISTPILMRYKTNYHANFNLDFRTMKEIFRIHYTSFKIIIWASLTMKVLNI